MNYLITGSSYHLIDAEIKKIVGDVNTETFYLDEVGIGDILEDLGYNSMFDEDKVLILKNFNVLAVSKNANESELDKILSYLESPNEHTRIIFTSPEKISSSRGPLKKIVSKLKVVETPIITKPYELAKILEGIVKAKGYAISSPALNTFASKCASNYDVAISELEKLTKIKGANKLITDADIEEYVSNYNTSDMFGFKDAVIGRDISKASEMLDDLEASKMEIIPLVVMLAKEYQLILNIKLLSDKRLANDAISKELNGMHPFRVKILREMSSKYTISELEQLVLELCNMDLRLTSEDNLGYDEIRKFLLML